MPGGFDCFDFFDFRNGKIQWNQAPLIKYHTHGNQTLGPKARSHAWICALTVRDFAQIPGGPDV
jgi:hypothetical protein